MASNKVEILTDPVWSLILEERILPYIPAIRMWWDRVDDLTVTHTGVYPVEGALPGLFYRFTRTAKRSPIRNIQAFPFIIVGYLQLPSMSGGVAKCVERVCQFGLKLEEFTIFEKHNLPSTFQQGQFLAVVPTALYEETQILSGQWIYLQQTELYELAKGRVPFTVRNKAMLKT